MPVQLGQNGRCLQDPFGVEVGNPCYDASMSRRIAHDIVLIASEVVIDIDL